MNEWMKKMKMNDTTRVQHETTRPNRSTKEALAAIIGFYFALFVTELYIFLISFRNSWYSSTCNVAPLWIPRAYNTSFQNTKQPRTYDVLLYIKLKITIQYQRHITPSFVFYHQLLWFPKTNLWPPSESQK